LTGSHGTTTLAAVSGSPPRQDSLARYLVDAAHSFPGESATLKEILDKVGERGLLVLCVALCVPFLVPVSIPGVSTVFGLALTVGALAVAMRRLPWLPRRMLDRPVSTAKLRASFEAGARRLGQFERLLRPRLVAVASLVRLNGLVLAFAGLLLMAPFGLVPFSNTLPAIAAMLLGLGMLYRDGAFVIAGYAATAATLAYFAALIAAAVWGGMRLGEVLG
jgi:hypothetical protein